MDSMANIALGFQTALGLSTLLACMAGVLLGTFIGVLPGMGPMAAISILLPLTFYLQPTDALVMLAGIYYGTQYGGSTASILLNLPGTSTSVVTCLDGYPMAQQGRAGLALFITTIASFFGATIAIIVMTICAPLLARVALGFGSPEYFSMMVLGLVAASTISAESPLRGLAMVVFGLLLGMVGTDVMSGERRFVFGLQPLFDGISLVPIAMGLFGVAEVVANYARPREAATARRISWRSMVPSRSEMKSSVGPALRGTAVGVGFGILPGTGSAIASFIAYALEKRVSKDPSRFGRGAIEGVVAPEASNNAAAQAAFIPTMTLGIPGDGVMALMLAALMIHGIIPGPGVITSNPELFWGLIASFWIGNLLLLILNIPLIGIWVRMLSIPYHVLAPSILFFMCIGAFSIRNLSFDVFLVIVFGAVGVAMMRMRLPAAPVLLGFILGPLIEEHLRRALLIARGDLSVFFTQPVSGAFLCMAIFLTIWSLTAAPRQRMRERRLGAGA
ncbi:hypothetical protein BSQ44_24645 [Aquibium oceanicum]|uniref:DUF112 domain-containing protein n=2 Tax=Aquibium oceanicum TaxID=1670800 RepID=A0A1L3SXU0_9HYPH|nr:tripartite tricarboxylate transporter permease [Aquibium oceanicum]APH74200.1 hypothetical protein BSQ44_24645 [Aquibium oceanicum]